MTEKRTVFISGTPYTVTISSEQEVLSAAYAAGGAIIGLWDKNRSGQSLAPAEYVVECAEDADEEFLERVVRRRLHMPWIIAETERLVIREFTAEDAAHMIQEDVGPGDEIFHRREKLTAYIDSQYRFFEYGIWAVVEKESMTVIGKAGLFQPTAEFLNVETNRVPAGRNTTNRVPAGRSFSAAKKRGYPAGTGISHLHSLAALRLCEGGVQGNLKLWYRPADRLYLRGH